MASFDWVHVHRKSNQTNIVIPGWAMPIAYFIQAIPTSNLWILNSFSPLFFNLEPPFFRSSIHQVVKSPGLLPIDTIIAEQPNCSLIIYSMGLQWIDTHYHGWKTMPCHLVSPSVRYNQTELRRMQDQIIKSKRAALRSFYKTCLHSASNWPNFKDRFYFPEMLDTKKLIEWLDRYGKKTVDIPDQRNITLHIDPSDPIGIKPDMVASTNRTVHIQCGHIPIEPLFSN
jgi:hypothetical protein